MNASLQLLTDRLIDETHAECCERVRQSNRYALKPQPLDHDAHVSDWRVATLDYIEGIAWLRRQEQTIQDGH